jgi:hypothetical protein
LPVNDKVPFLPKLPSRSQPLGPLASSNLPKMPPKVAEIKPKPKQGIIFDDDDEEDYNFNKNTKPAASNILNKPNAITFSNTDKKKRLFDDDDDLTDNFLVKKKPNMET